MKILITGANGQVGRALRENDDIRRNRLILTSRTAEEGVLALDMSDSEGIKRLVVDARPDVIINCAAYTAVEKAEEEREACMTINAAAAGVLAESAEEVGARLFHVSTDFVFDGKKNCPYLEEDKTGPLSIYAKSKEEGERLVLEKCSRACIVRSAWLYGEGHNFVRTILRLAKTKDELRVVSDQIGSPTSARELARIIAFLVDRNASGIIHGVCSGSVSWYELAVKALWLAGSKTRVIPVSTVEYGSKVERPLYTVLSNEKLASMGYEVASWETSLKEYLEESQNNK